MSANVYIQKAYEYLGVIQRSPLGKITEWIFGSINIENNANIKLQKLAGEIIPACKNAFELTNSCLSFNAEKRTVTGIQPGKEIDLLKNFYGFSKLVLQAKKTELQAQSVILETANIDLKNRLRASKTEIATLEANEKAISAFIGSQNIAASKFFPSRIKHVINTTKNIAVETFSNVRDLTGGAVSASVAMIVACKTVSYLVSTKLLILTLSGAFAWNQYKQRTHQ